MNPALQTIVRDAYSLFASYTIGRTLDVCKLCCVTDAEEKELVETPLPAISADLFARAYYASARGHSESELWEMKHFLPRVLELVGNYEFPTHSAEITFQRLDLHQPAWWSAPERELLAAFALAYFRQSLVCYPLPMGEELSNLLVMFGIAHFDLEPLLQAWSSRPGLPALLHLKDLLLREIKFTAPTGLRVGNPFATRPVSDAICSWLRRDSTRATFTDAIERVLLLDDCQPDEVEAVLLSLDDDAEAAKLSLDYELTQLSLAYEVLQNGLG